MLSLDAARRNRAHTDWDNLAIPVPWFLGRRTVKPSLDDLLPLVRLPADSAADARALVGRLRLTPLDARGAYGFWAAQSVGDDIVVYKDDARATEIARIPSFRQQQAQEPGKPNLSISDFVAPRESLAPDYVGAFVLTVEVHAGDVGGTDRLAAMLSARLAGAFAEHLHRQVRDDWGFKDAESSTRDDLLAGRYRGERVSPASRMWPDVAGRGVLSRLLHTESIGITLDESHEWHPGATIGGLYFAHEDAGPFDIGPIGRDQLEDYALRTGEPLSRVENRLGDLVGA